jgi:prevent-host-death family protein
MKSEKHRWQLQTAKARFSELFRRARSEGPQYVTRQGKEAVVVLPAEEFERLKGRSRRTKTSLTRFFAESPLVGSAIDLERKPDYGRKVKL